MQYNVNSGCPLKNSKESCRHLKGRKRELLSQLVQPLCSWSIKHQLSFTKYNHVMFWAACCIAFFGFPRCSEFTVSDKSFIIDTHLAPGDIKADKLPFLENLVLNIKKSKTDQFGRGFSIVLANKFRDMSCFSHKISFTP